MSRANRIERDWLRHSILRGMAVQRSIQWRKINRDRCWRCWRLTITNTDQPSLSIKVPITRHQFPGWHWFVFSFGNFFIKRRRASKGMALIIFPPRKKEEEKSVASSTVGRPSSSGLLIYFLLSLFFLAFFLFSSSSFSFSAPTIVCVLCPLSIRRRGFQLIIADCLSLMLISNRRTRCRRLPLRCFQECFYRLSFVWLTFKRAFRFLH